MKFCTICKKYYFNCEKHKCPPCWKVFHEEFLGDDFLKIYEYTYDDAAIEYAKNYDTVYELRLLEGEIIIIEIEPFNGGERKKIEISGELEPVYNAKIIKNE